MYDIEYIDEYNFINDIREVDIISKIIFMLFH
jgi:hypothetical protein